MGAINIFDTHILAGVVQEVIPAATFFRDRYFPTNEDTDIFCSEKVLVEYKDGDRKLAPFVIARKGDVLIGREQHDIYEFEPPYIAPSRLLTLDDLNKLGFGEDLYAGSTPADRAVAITLKDLAELDARITRREEWMAAQTMINNGCTAVEYIDKKEMALAFEIYFYDRNKTNPGRYIVADYWDDTLGNLWRDLEIMLEALFDRGIAATDLIVGPLVGEFLSSHHLLGRLLASRRMEIGKLRPKVNSPGVIWLGYLKISGVKLDIFVVRETYSDSEGKQKRFFPDKGAMITKPNCGHLMYAGVTQLEEDANYYTYYGSRIPKFIVNRNRSIRKLRLASKPLAAPLTKSPWIFSPNVLR